MSHENLERAEKTINSLLNKAEETARKSEDKIAHYREKIAEAKKSIETAQILDNRKMYADAMAQIREEEVNIEFETGRIKRTKDLPLMGQEEYEELLNAVYSESLNYLDEENIKIGNCLLEARKRAEEINQIIARTHKAVVCLERKVMRAKPPESDQVGKRDPESYFYMNGEGFDRANYRRRAGHIDPAIYINSICQRPDSIKLMEDAKAHNANI